MKRKKDVRKYATEQESPSMLIDFNDRPPDSPFVERVWRSHSDYGGVFHSIASCQWDLVVSRVAGRSHAQLIHEMFALDRIGTDGLKFEGTWQLNSC
jgi:hypothetical protein